MKPEHTPEPWTVDNPLAKNSPQRFIWSGPKLVAGLYSTSLWHGNVDADAERIIACVNACAGITDPGGLRRQRDELLMVLESIVLSYGYTKQGSVGILGCGPSNELMGQARAAIARAKGA